MFLRFAGLLLGYALSAPAALPGELPAGLQNVPYITRPTAPGLPPPLTFSLAGGALPPGLALAPQSGIISGTPTSLGVFAFALQVSDSGSPPQTTTNDFSITIRTIYGSGPGGPIVVLTDTNNPFTRYYAEILLAEGLNEFSLEEMASVTEPVLAQYDIAILGEMALTPAQVGLLSNWVQEGGKLITMRPDPQLAGLLGVAYTGSNLANAYLRVNTTSAIGAGIAGQTLQFHGPADLYTLEGAASLATLYSNALTATLGPNPAVTLREVGTNQGQAASFAFDLARSIVYTRQGNPAWAGQHRDGNSVLRPHDLFFGGAEPDWIDLGKVAIPQADEQQRLFANLLLSMNANRRPLPRFWYFPRELKAVLVMTADNHGGGGTAGRFNNYLSLSSTNGSVADWETVRSSVYLYATEPLTDAQASNYTGQGFEIGLHLNTGCADYDRQSLDDFFRQQLADWRSSFPSLPAPTTHRTHCVAWSDYTTMAEVEYLYGIRLDTTYYYYPPSWVNNQPGFFTGSALPMRFATAEGHVIDVYQASTQMTDESGQSFPYTINALLDGALGPEGYYGAFVANFHCDYADSAQSDASVAAALSRGVPIISARQLLTWVDARNASSFQAITWTNHHLRFSVQADSAARGLQAMVPVPCGLSLSGLTYNGNSTNCNLRVIKGLPYGVFPAAPGDYEVAFTQDTTPPSVTSVVPTNGAANVDRYGSITVSFNETMDASTLNTNTLTLQDALDHPVDLTIAYNPSLATAVLTPRSPLGPLTNYTMTVKGGPGGVADLAGNVLSNGFVSTFVTRGHEAYTLWNDATVPAPGAYENGISVELGLKFRSEVDGYVTGIRFFKAPSGTGTHVGSLWSSTGALLGQAPFLNETSSGWQQQALTHPVPILSNTTYVVSYHAPEGNYVANLGFFSTSGVTNSPLRALRDGEDGGNGVYLYGPTSLCPTQTWEAVNYWVDVVVQTPVTLVAGVGADDKTYDGTTRASLHTNEPVVLSGALDNDLLSLVTNGYAADFASPGATSALPVAVTGLGLSGPNAGRYVLLQPTGLTASILPRRITGSVTVSNKVYDATPSATIASRTLTGVLGQDDVRYTGGEAAFADPNAGTAKPVTVTGLGLAGTDANNYAVNSNAVAEADILPANLMVTAHNQGRVYGASNPTFSVGYTGFLGTDSVQVLSGNPEVTTMATVTSPVGRYPISPALGTLAATNYLFQFVDGTLTIEPAPLLVQANAASRAYGQTNPVFSATYTGFVNGEDASALGGAVVFSTTAETNSPVGTYPIEISGLLCTNYALSYSNGTLTITVAGVAMALDSSANPSPTGSNVTLTATVTAVPPGSGIPTGAVQFLADGVALDAPIALSGGSASLTTSTLAHGYRVIGAEYAGDGNFQGSTNALSPSLLVNTAPVAGGMSMSTSQNQAASLSATELLTQCSDADRDSLTIAAVNSPSAQGGTVTFNGSSALYAPAPAFNGSDRFTYTVRDSYNATATGTVTVTVRGLVVPPPSITAVKPQPDGTMEIQCAGIASQYYVLQATPDFSAWTAVITNASDSSGLMQFLDLNATNHSVRFYRVTIP